MLCETFVNHIVELCWTFQVAVEMPTRILEARKPNIIQLSEIL